MSDSIITSEPNRITVTTGSLVTQYSDHPLSAAKQITLLHTQIKQLTERLASAEAERDVERRDRTAAEFEMLADRELLRELYEHEINEYGRWTAGMCQRVCVAAKGGRDEI